MHDPVCFGPIRGLSTSGEDERLLQADDAAAAAAQHRLVSTNRAPVPVRCGPTLLRVAEEVPLATSLKRFAIQFPWIVVIHAHCGHDVRLAWEERGFAAEEVDDELFV